MRFPEKPGKAGMGGLQKINRQAGNNRKMRRVQNFLDLSLRHFAFSAPLRFFWTVKLVTAGQRLKLLFESRAKPASYLELK